jgi:cytidylate kinase
MPQLQASNFAVKYGTDPVLTERAFATLATGSAVVLAVSGKLGAGKDSAAPLIMEELEHGDALHEFFAKHLKDEVDQVIELVKAHDTQVDAAMATVEDQLVPFEQAAVVVARLWDEVKSGRVAHSRIRTDNTRFALQFWGTDVRRTQDDNYWVKLAIASTIERLADGESVFVTDARFTNEIDSLTALGAYTVRLKVSPEVQAARILARDGIVPTDEALHHVSETALDRYEELGLFTAVVDTDHLTREEVVAEALAAIRATKGE